MKKWNHQEALKDELGPESWFYNSDNGVPHARILRTPDGCSWAVVIRPKNHKGWLLHLYEEDPSRWSTFESLEEAKAYAEVVRKLEGDE